MTRSTNQEVANQKATDQLTVLPTCHEPLEILRQDEAFVVVNKPSRLLSVPGRSTWNRDCVIERLRVDFPGVHAVHRLDFDTSGLLVVPLDKPSLSHLSRQFQARQVRKTYIAVVHGWVEAEEGRIEEPIAPDADNRPKSKICAGGKPAVTDYRVLERDAQANTTRLALYPVTGRSHQLRLHCRALGHPILGCDFYAPEVVRQMADRLLLHASELEFAHPVSGDRVQFHCPAPF
ncbi:RluA family pseudouridine synthase [Marinimicrobium sp. C2-29]|uniref:RluA family pseudouridine synthase n=1 Tax=Marinimicrobium sp. C2-29 TaxID=3139825 RepID=UPI003138F11E